MYVYSRRGGHLLVAEQSASERAVQSALTDFDPGLVLTWELDSHGRRVWNVHKVISEERPAIFVCTWRDETGAPRDLTFGLLDEVKRLREVDTMAAIDAHNAKIRADEDRAFEDAAHELARDITPRMHGKKSVPTFGAVGGKRKARERYKRLGFE